jgi:plastocyanin
MTPARSLRTSLALLVASVLLTGCGGDDKGGDLKVTGSVDAQGAGGQQTVAIDMTDDLTFVPNVIRAKVGTLALTAKNVGRIPHNLQFADASKGKLSTVKGRATGTLTVTFDTAGTYRFTCTFHHGMDGEVVVKG